MPTRFVKRGHVTVMVSDLERAVRFYTNALGMTLRARRGDAYAEVELAGLTLALQRSDRRSVPPGPLPVHVSIGFDVANLEGAMLVMRERGVIFASHVAEDDEVRIAYFVDEDGTPLYLREPKTPAAP